MCLLDAPGYLETGVNCVTHCVTPKRALVRILHGQMKLNKAEKKEVNFLSFKGFWSIYLRPGQH